MFSGELPKQLPVSLEVLNFGDDEYAASANKFTGGIPSEWGALTNLKELKMVKCGLDGKALSTRAERFNGCITRTSCVQESCHSRSFA